MTAGPTRRPAGRLLPLLAVAAALALVGCSRVTAVGDAAGSPTPSDRATPVDAGSFARGACMAYPPTKGDRHLTILLDAGHGGIDPGSVGTTESGSTIDEADLTLPVELDTMALLRAQGFRVVVSRTGNTTVLRLGPGDTDQGTLSLQGSHDDVAARDRCANDAKASALVGIYFDSGASAANAGSITAYDGDRPFSAANLRLATLLQHNVLLRLNAQGWGIPDDGVQPDTALGSYVGAASGGGLAAQAANYDHLLLIGPAQAGYFSSPSTMPGAVIEPLYITDPFEGSIADSTRGQTTIAQGIAAAVEQFLPPSPTTKRAGAGGSV